MSDLFMSYYIEETARSNKRWISQCSKMPKISDFLLVVHWNEIPIPKRFWHIRLLILLVCSLFYVNRYCACTISRDIYPVCKIKVYIWIFHPHIVSVHYDAFIGLWWRIRGIYSRYPMLNSKLSENFQSRPTFVKFWQFLAIGVKF